MPTDAPAPDATARCPVAANLAAIREGIARAAAEAGRDPAEVTLVAAAKRQPAGRVAAALAAGQHVYGENRVQEGQQRWRERRGDVPGLRLHLIGPLQTNKVRDAVALFDVIETVDRPRLVRALAEEMARSGRRPDCLLQVNTGEEPQKNGVPPAALPDLIRLAVEEAGLPVRGLMCIPPVDEPPAPHFALLAALAKAHGLSWLSMGMSADYPAAVHQGATHVRVGSALFGPRDSG